MMHIIGIFTYAHFNVTNLMQFFPIAQHIYLQLLASVTISKGPVI